MLATTMPLPTPRALAGPCRFAASILSLLALTLLVSRADGADAVSSKASSSSSSSPPRPLHWGFSTSAFQVEGSVRADGRSPSIWDQWSHRPNTIADGSNADIASDHYARYASDFALMKDQMHPNMYRFSLSWSRIMQPDNKQVNAAAVAHYRAMIDAMIASGAQPVATLYHWDLPASLMDSCGGWTSPQIVDAFRTYTEAVVDAFGDKIRYWLTFNEPRAECTKAYRADHFFPPGLNDARLTYACMHNHVLAHAAAAAVIRDRAQRTGQAAWVGLAADTEWYEPLTADSAADEAAAQRALEYNFGWAVDPLVTGDYPASMRADLRLADGVLPVFTPAQQRAIKGTVDFIGYNYYTASWAAADDAADAAEGAFRLQQVRGSAAHPEPIGPPTAIDWQRSVPAGLTKLTRWLAHRYPGMDLWVTENGVATDGGPQDPARITFFEEHLRALGLAMVPASAATPMPSVLGTAVSESAPQPLATGAAPVVVYLAWSLLDNFEWMQGYTSRFGVIGVDMASPERTRTVRPSGPWLGAYFAAAPAARWTKAQAAGVAGVTASAASDAENEMHVDADGRETQGATSTLGSKSSSAGEVVPARGLALACLAPASLLLASLV